MPFLDTLFTSVMADDPNVRRAIVDPTEAGPVLVVGPDAVLAFPVAPQCIQPIARW